MERGCPATSERIHLTRAFVLTQAFLCRQDLAIHQTIQLNRYKGHIGI